jgi:hypothetical protein
MKTRTTNWETSSARRLWRGLAEATPGRHRPRRALPGEFPAVPPTRTTNLRLLRGNAKRRSAPCGRLRGKHRSSKFGVVLPELQHSDRRCTEKRRSWTTHTAVQPRRPGRAHARAVDYSRIEHEGQIPSHGPGFSNRSNPRHTTRTSFAFRPGHLETSAGEGYRPEEVERA